MSALLWLLLFALFALLPLLPLLAFSCRLFESLDCCALEASLDLSSPEAGGGEGEGDDLSAGGGGEGDDLSAGGGGEGEGDDDLSAAAGEGGLAALLLFALLPPPPRACSALLPLLPWSSARRGTAVSSADAGPAAAKRKAAATARRAKAAAARTRGRAILGVVAFCVVISQAKKMTRTWVNKGENEQGEEREREEREKSLRKFRTRGEPSSSVSFLGNDLTPIESSPGTSNGALFERCLIRR